MLEQQKRFRAEEDRKAREALAVYSQRKELQRIEQRDAPSLPDQ